MNSNNLDQDFFRKSHQPIVVSHSQKKALVNGFALHMMPIELINYLYRFVDPTLQAL